MNGLPVIDAHHHLWAPVSDPGKVEYVWLRDIGAPKPFGDPTPIQRDYLLDEFLDEPAPRRLAGSVHVQCDPRIPAPVAETAFIQGIGDASGFPIMLVGFADLCAGDFPKVLARHKAFPNLRGIRQILSYLPDRPELSYAEFNLLDDLAWRGHFALLADHDLRFDLQLYPEQMAQAADFLEEHPDTPVAIDHLGSPHDTSDAGIALWEDGMAALSALPQVSVKLSGYAAFCEGEPGTLAAHLTGRTLEMFGAGRVMFASNFPVDGLKLTYPALLDFVLSQVPEDQKRAVMHDTAHSFYGF